MELDRVSVRILDLDLLASGPGLDLAAETGARRFQLVDVRGEIVDVKNDPIRAAGFLPAAVGQRA